VSASTSRLRLGRVADDVRNFDEAADEVGLFLDTVEEADAPDALDEDAQRAVGDADHLLDDCRGADLVEVVPDRLLDVLVLRGDENEHTVSGDHVVDEPDRPLLPDRERQHGIGEDDRVLERQERQGGGKLDLFDVQLLVENLCHATRLQCS